MGQLPSPLMLCIIVLVFWEIGSLLWLWLSFWLFWFYRALHDERTPHWDVCDSFFFFFWFDIFWICIFASCAGMGLEEVGGGCFDGFQNVMGLQGGLAFELTCLPPYTPHSFTHSHSHSSTHTHTHTQASSMFTSPFF